MSLRLRTTLCTLSLVLGLTSPLHLSAADEVPFVTTPDHVTLEMLRIAQVGPQDHVIDLGSGDGRIVITAARQFGASGLGVEIVPDLVARSRDNARSAGVADRAQFRIQDIFDTDLSAASVVTMYLLPEVNLQLRPRLRGSGVGPHPPGRWPMRRHLEHGSVVGPSLVSCWLTPTTTLCKTAAR